MHIPKELRAPLAQQFAAFMIILAVFGFGMMRNANGIKDNVQSECQDRAVAAKAVNLVLDQMITGAEESKVFSQTEKTERIELWAAVKQPVVPCDQP